MEPEFFHYPIQLNIIGSIPVLFYLLSKRKNDYTHNGYFRVFFCMLSCGGYVGYADHLT